MNSEISPDILLYGILGGLVPAYIWLSFWLREEAHQEPRGKILGCFIVGMLTVFIAIPLERSVGIFFIQYSLPSLFLWALIEELVKFYAAYFVVLQSRFVDEPADSIIYLITAALGFACMENILYLLSALHTFGIPDGFDSVKLRFIGATVLHIVATGSIGLVIGYTFFKTKIIKNISLVFSILFATLLHTGYNYFIMTYTNDDEKVFAIFSMVWLGMFVILTVLQRIKRIKKLY